jgi:adenylosuccinate synthase
VYGIFKAYCTRVGSGPFPTELFDETGEKIRRIGNEFGAVTGRPRRCGWLDLVALKYTVMVDGVTDLIMMKSDCLDDFETIRVCTSYRIGGQETQQFPFDTAAEIEPVYTDFKGWNTDLTGIRKEADLPKAFKDYIKFMEDYLGVPISIISLGPDREATIER